MSSVTNQHTLEVIDMRVLIEYEISELEPELRYGGALKIGTGKLDFDICLMVPFGRLPELGITGNPAVLRNQVRIAIKKAKEEVELTDVEYMVFFKMLMPLASALWTQIKLFSAWRKSAGMPGDLKLSGLPGRGFYEMSPEVAGFLNQKKFDCRIQNRNEN